MIEERLRVGKRDTSHGRVRVRSYVREAPVSADVELRSERVEVERRPVDRPVSAGDDAFRERSIEAEEFAEKRRSSPRRPASSRRSACAARVKPDARRSPTPCATPRSRSRTSGPDAIPTSTVDKPPRAALRRRLQLIENRVSPPGSRATEAAS